MFSTAKKILIHISLLNFLNFFLTRVKEECIYALCVGLTEGNTRKSTQEKQAAINQRAVSETMLLLK